MPTRQFPLTAAEFDAITTAPILATRSEPDYFTVSEAERLWRMVTCLEGLVVITDWCIDTTMTTVETIRQQIINDFSGQTVPSIPVSQWLENWWHGLFDEVLEMTASPGGGGNS